MLQNCCYPLLQTFCVLPLLAIVFLSCCMHGRSKRAGDAFLMQTCCVLPVFAHIVLYCFIHELPPLVTAQHCGADMHDAGLPYQVRASLAVSRRFDACIPTRCCVACRMEIAWVSPAPDGLQRSQPVFCLHGPEAASELAMLDAVLGLTSHAVPVLPGLISSSASGKRSGRLHPPAVDSAAAHSMVAEPQLLADAGGERAAAGSQVEPTHVNVAATSGECQSVAEQFNLNLEQTAVLQQCDGWRNAATGGSPICVVHGPFGSGKSSLLVAVIHFLLRCTSAPKRNPLSNLR